MEIWLDTINLKIIKEAGELGWITGITTNPAILSSRGHVNRFLLDQLLEAQSGKVAVQVTTHTAHHMIEEARHIFNISSRFLIKIPVTKEGLCAMHILSKENIPTLGTAVFHPHQALLAALAGASYIAPYVSHMASKGIDIWNALNAMQSILKQGYKTKIMMAALTEIEEVMRSAQLGMDAATLPEKLFTSFVETTSLTEEAMQKLHEIWEQRCGDTSLLHLL